jgi:hypothetical protein
LARTAAVEPVSEHEPLLTNDHSLATEKVELIAN